MMVLACFHTKLDEFHFTVPAKKMLKDVYDNEHALRGHFQFHFQFCIIITSILDTIHLNFILFLTITLSDFIF